VHRTISRRWLGRHAAAVALCLGWLALLAGPASADDGSLLIDVPGDGIGFTHDPGRAFLDVQKLYPGGSGSGEFEVRNASPHDATLDLLATGVVSDENGCLQPESREPGEGCGADGGELQDWLVVTISREGNDARELWQGTLGGLAAGVDLAATMPAGATWRLRMTVALPQAASNDTMTDSVTFGTRLTATSTDATSTVAGPQVGATGDQPPPTSLVAGPQVGLPGTGASVSLWMLVLDALVLAAGACLVVAARRGRSLA
jgi:hypothetical protein